MDLGRFGAGLEPASVIKKAAAALFAAAALCCFAAFAQSGKPKIALYIVNDALTDSQKRVLTAKFLKPFTESGAYDVVDRSDMFTEQAAKERIKQMDGDVNEKEIIKIGFEAGARYVCMVDLVNAFGTAYNVSARLVDVETAKIFGVQGETDIQDLDDISGAASEVFKQMHGKSADAAKSVASKTVNSGPKLRTAAEYYERGKEYYKNGDYDRAIVDFTEAIRRGSSDVRYRGGRGSAYYAKKEYAKAAADFTEVILLDPQNTVYRNYRGDAYSAMNDYDKAIADYEAAVKFNPGDTDAKAKLEKLKSQTARGGAASGDNNSFLDPRDRKTYKIKRVGGHTWFMQDLANEREKYTWYEAATACPKGWHLPDNKEWEALGKEDLGEFTEKSSGKWWSSTETAGSGAHDWSVSKKGKLSRSGLNSKDGSSHYVRCVQD
jgi:tetratricopeptide (TPR) repeat protein